MLGALLPQTRQLVLRELVRSGEEWVHIHALARNAGIHAANARRELRNLEAAGIAESNRVGGQVHFRLNPRCPGSFATGDTRADSDVDLMIVGDLSLKDLAAPIAEAQRELAREVNPSVYDVADYRERLDRTDSFIARVHRGERIILQGDSDELD